jgi:hypothetical protein
MHAWYLSGTVTSYWSTKRGFRPQQVQQSSSPRPRTWNSTADSSNLFSRELGLLTSFIRRVSVSFSLTLSLPLCLSPPLFPRVLLSDDCCCLVTTISLSLCKVPKTRNSAAWTIAIAIPPPKQCNNNCASYCYQRHQYQHHHIITAVSAVADIDKHIAIDKHRHSISRYAPPLSPTQSLFSAVHPFDFLETPPRLHPPRPKP